MQTTFRCRHAAAIPVLVGALVAGLVMGAGPVPVAAAAPAAPSGPQAAPPRETSASPSAKPKKHKKRPVVTKIRPRAGVVTGGTRLTITGRNFARVKSIVINGQRLERVKVRSRSRIVATTPAGLRGSYPVVVRTKKGASRPTKAARFTYRDPQRRDSTKIQARTSTVTGTGVVWVTGGTDLDDPLLTNPWVVGVGPGGSVPVVGAGYYLPPGGAVFPSGLAGTVTGISTQAADVTAVTVAPTSFDDVLGRMDVEYADGPASGRSRREVTDSSLTFENLAPNAFGCKNDDGQNVAFKGSLGMRLENISKSFELIKPDLGYGGYVSAWVRYDVVLSGHVTVEAEMKCALSTAWVNAHRKVIPIGTTGATVSFGPKAEFSVTGSGTVKLTQRTRRMVGYTYDQGRTEPIDVRKDLGLQVTGGNVTFEVGAEAGVSVQFGLLDRAGIELAVTLALSGKVTASTPPPKVCASLSVGVKIKINAFIDAWVARWESPGYEHTWPFAKYDKCTPPTTAAADAGGPVITSLRLGQATSGSYYETRMTTEDDRGGQWAVVGGSLPQGLTLDSSDGWVSGTPSGRVGDYLAQVRFTDSSNRATTSPVRLYLAPPTPVSGGKVQATLTWGSEADLDLHVIDPDGERIYFNNRSSDSGGALDRDANADCGEAVSDPIENIYWDEAAPSGSYDVYVDTYSSCGASDLSWHLVVRVGGRVVLDRSGWGDSSTYTFGVGAARRVAVTSTPARLRDAEASPKRAR